MLGAGLDKTPPRFYDEGVVGLDARAFDSTCDEWLPMVDDGWVSEGWLVD